MAAPVLSAAVVVVVAVVAVVVQISVFVAERVKSVPAESFAEGLSLSKTK